MFTIKINNLKTFDEVKISNRLNKGQDVETIAVREDMEVEKVQEIVEKLQDEVNQ